MAQQIATMQNQVYNGLTFISEKSQVAEVAEVGELAEAPANPDETLS
jgi:hypothetical protein